MKRAITYLALIALGLVFVLPLVWMLSTSLKPIEQTMQTPPAWIPGEWKFQNYFDAVVYGRDTLGYIPFLVYFRNTLMVTFLAVAGAVVSNALVAYAFARLRFWGREFFFGLTIATMMVPFPVLMVPTFQLFKWLDWIGTFRPLWVPLWFGSAFSIFLLRQFFRTIPMELSEAAKLDGCSEFRIFWEVIVPLARPALAVVALFTFMYSWNDFLAPLIYLVDQHTFTLSLGLQAYQSQHGGTQWHLLMAATTIVVAPVIIVFFFAQKQFIKGIAMSGLKG